MPNVALKKMNPEIKTLKSNRPVTPFSKKSARKKTNDDFSCLSRPSSSSSIKSLRYESDDDSHKKKNMFLNYHKTIVGDTCVKLQPIVTQPILKAPITPYRTKNKKMIAKQIELPPIPTNIGSHKEKGEFFENGKNQARKADLDKLSDHYGKLDISVVKIFPETETLKEDEVPVQKAHALDELSTKLKTHIKKLEQNSIAGFNTKIDETCKILKNVHDILNEKNDFTSHFVSRPLVLKILFQVLNSNVPALCIYTANMLLKMNITNRNLVKVFKLIFKLATMEDVQFDDCNIVDNLLFAIEEIGIQHIDELTLHGLKALEAFVDMDVFNFNISEKCSVCLSQLLNKLNTQIAVDENEFYKSQIIIQIVFILHSIADKYNSLTNKDSITIILKTLENSFLSPKDLHVIVRYISKIADTDEGSKPMAECGKDYLLLILTTLKSYILYPDIVEQLSFVIGRVVAINEATALLFAASPHLEITVMVFNEYMAELIKMKEIVSHSYKTLEEEDTISHLDMVRVVLKIMSIWVNICLNSDVGGYLASNDSLISYLMEVIETVSSLSNKITDVILHSLLVVIGNLTYYLNNYSKMCVNIVERILPLLDDKFSSEVRLESVTVLQNLSRSPLIRVFIQEHCLIPVFVNLLDKDGRDFNTAILGIIMNILMDQTTRSMFYKEGGITKILHKLHMCVDRDWNKCALICQILWNYCEGDKSICTPLSNIEINHLVQFLTYAVDEKEENNNETFSEISREKGEFNKVARKLLDSLKKKILL